MIIKISEGKEYLKINYYRRKWWLVMVLGGALVGLWNFYY